MKVLYLSSVFPKRSETFVYREFLGLREKGIDVGAASLHPPEEDFADGTLQALASEVVPVYGSGYRQLLWDAGAFLLRFPLRTAGVIRVALSDALFASDVAFWYRPKLILQAIAALGLAHRIVSAENSASLCKPYTHLHIHMAHAAATVGMYAAQALRIPFSFTGHASDLFRERCLLKEKLERSAFVVCISEWHRSWYRQIVDRSDSEFPLIRCGVSVASAPASFVPHSDLRILTIARLVEKKGIDVLVEACRILCSQGIGISCTIAGDGPEVDHLRELAKGLPVEFIGAVDHHDVPALLDKADVFVLPCLVAADGDRDGIPVVLMEAMASATCALAGDLPTIRELIVDGQCGCLVPPGDALVLAKRLLALWADPDIREVLGSAGRRRVSDEFSSDINLDRLVRSFLRHSGSVEPLVCRDAISSRYFLVTACRDEAQYAKRCLDSILKQSVLPNLWVIVDDGSTDETPSILAEYAAKYPWIKILRREDRGTRAVGPGVVDAFYAGLDTVPINEFEFLCKCDLDLDLPPQYFETLIRRMNENPALGTCSGKAYFERNGRYVSEKCGDEMSVGMTKFYRVSCFKAIGGFVREVMWDGIDCHRCRMLGWIACSWVDPELRFVHLRPMGSSQRGILTGRMRHGYGQYFMGTGFLYMTASSIFRFAHPPFVLGGIAMWWGYVRSLLARQPRYNDWGFRQFLHKYQLQCLLRGKKVATETSCRSGIESIQKQILLPSCE